MFSYVVVTLLEKQRITSSAHMGTVWIMKAYIYQSHQV